ncbi:MAG: hypothetical protein ABJL55_01825 [Roseibium sp.]
MRFIGRTSKKVRQLVGALLLLPFLFASAIPQGFMPASTGDGWFTVTICTSDGLRTVVLNENGQEISDRGGVDDTRTIKDHCVFSALANLAISTQPHNERFPTAGAPLHWSVVSHDLIPDKTNTQLGARAPPILI